VWVGDDTTFRAFFIQTAAIASNLVKKERFFLPTDDKPAACLAGLVASRRRVTLGHAIARAF
jgi:hypothetical protein